MYVAFKQICAEVDKVEKSGAMISTVIILYVAIDAMGFLSMPKEKDKNNSEDFINWVNKYLKTDTSQEYQYQGSDLWSDRCAKLHSYSSYSEYAKKNESKILGHHDGSEHRYDSSESESLVLISVPRFVEDFYDALKGFIKDALDNPGLKRRIDSRISVFCQQFDINKVE